MPQEDPAFESTNHLCLSEPVDSESALGETQRHDPYKALRSSGYRRFLLGNVISVIGRQMTGLAVGWEIYRRTHSPTLLGLAGISAGALSPRLRRGYAVFPMPKLFC